MRSRYGADGFAAACARAPPPSGAGASVSRFARRRAQFDAAVAKSGAAIGALDEVLQRTGTIVARLADAHARDEKTLGDLYEHDMLAGNERLERAVAAVARTKGAEPKPAPCGPQQQQRRWWEVLPNEK